MDAVSVNKIDVDLALFEKCFSKAAQNVIGTMSGLELCENCSNVKIDLIDDSCLIGLMSLTGTFNSIVFISIPSAAAAVIVSYMTGIQAEELDKSDIFDGVAEMVNMIAGSARTYLTGTDYNLQLTTPFTIVGENSAIISKGRVPGFSINFTLSDMSFNIKLFVL